MQSSQLHRWPRIRIEKCSFATQSVTVIHHVDRKQQQLEYLNNNQAEHASFQPDSTQLYFPCNCKETEKKSISQLQPSYFCQFCKMWNCASTLESCWFSHKKGKCGCIAISPGSPPAVATHSFISAHQIRWGFISFHGLKSWENNWFSVWTRVPWVWSAGDATW